MERVQGAHVREDTGPQVSRQYNSRNVKGVFHAAGSMA